jgi:ketosteroid isomerase-like protein
LKAQCTIQDRAEIDRALIEQRIRGMLDRRERDDTEGMFEYFADDCVYSASSWQGSPVRIELHGKQACAHLAHQLSVQFENFGTIIHKLIVDGQQVAVHRTSRLRNRGTGKTVEVDIWNFLTFRDGLIAEFAEYPDTRFMAALDDRDV